MKLRFLIKRSVPSLLIDTFVQSEVFFYSSFLLLAVNVKMLTLLVVCLLHPRSSSSMDTDGKP